MSAYDPNEIYSRDRIIELEKRLRDAKDLLRAALLARLSADLYTRIRQYLHSTQPDAVVAPFGVCRGCHEPITSFHNINGCTADRDGKHE